DERAAITDFSLLWSLFESRILETKGNVEKICEVVGKWQESGTLNADAFDRDVAYFRERYYFEGAFTYHFDDLNFRNSDRENLVRAVIDGSDNDPFSRMAAILIIIFRYRNNLFHGVKWQYELRGQFGNFATANIVLMKVLERHGRLA
ncbi:MAG: hypothetical protein RLN70_07735, partial [Rhodospirillaceae bacterium]